ncbi:hypothetical protein DIPPA_00709 [Diplonema papillatum]|nr:hypothetical protein DIPPA_00709 [Diplonema papillatum]
MPEAEEKAAKKRFDPAALLGKYGWKEGAGVGKDLQGASTYIRVHKKQDGYGLGADKAAFKEKDVKKFAHLLDDALAKVNSSTKQKKKGKKAAKRDAVSPSTSPAAAPEPAAAAGDLPKEHDFLPSHAKLVDGHIEKDPEVSSDDSDSSSSDEGAGGPISVVSDADLFAACKGARFGKLARHTNSQAKIARIRDVEAQSSALLVAQMRARWGLNAAKRRPSRSPHRSPAAAPQRSPRRSPAAAPLKSPKKKSRKLDSPAEAEPPAKKAKKQRKSEPEQDEEEKKQKKDKKASSLQPDVAVEETTAKKTKKDKKEKKQAAEAEEPAAKKDKKEKKAKRQNDDEPAVATKKDKKRKRDADATS